MVTDPAPVRRRADPVMILFGVCIAAAVTALIITALWFLTADVDPATQMPTSHIWVSWTCDDWMEADNPTRNAAISDMVVVSGHFVDGETVQSTVSSACDNTVNQHRRVTDFVPR